MPRISYTAAEIARRGEEIYHREIEPGIANEKSGSFVVLDIESGDFEIDTQDLAASMRLLARRPNAVPYGLRIGSRSAYRMGCSMRPQS